MTNVDLEAVRAQVESLRYAKQKIAEMKVLESMARDAIEEAMGTGEIGQLDGETVITWTTFKKRQFRQDKLKETHPELVEEYTELTESRQFKVVT